MSLAQPPTICLNMIVKDESHVIRRCLDSVRPFIHHWVIVDTGSTDGTQTLIRELLADVPGELHERPWKNFGHNRSEALELARGRADYCLIIDADEVLSAEPGFAMPRLDADEYLVRHEAGGPHGSFYLTQLVRSRLPWRYVGVLHEVIQCDEPHTTQKLEGLVCRGFFDSARNVDPKAKYRRDAEVLKQALEQEPDNSRYVFYLAQSYRDSDQLELAIDTYRGRVAMGGWDQEVWYSLFQVAVLLERSGGDFAPALAAYLDAFQFRPARAEPLCELARHFRQRQQYAKAYLFARQAAEIPLTDDILFLDRTVYDWRALDELCVSAFYVGRHEECRAAGQHLLASGRLPEGERARVSENIGFAVAELASQPRPTARDAKNAAKRARRKRR